MITFPLENPLPDFQKFKEVLKGERKPEKVHFVELLVDEEIIRFITQNVFGDKWTPLGINVNAYVKQYINFYYRMGYDYVPVCSISGSINLHKDFAFYGMPRTRDTAILSRGERSWAREGKGVITSWEDFERFPWDKIKLDLKTCELFSKYLPEGMAMTFNTSLFEHVLERLLGYEGLFYLLYDDPDLVKAVFNKWGSKVYEFYESILSIENVGAIFHSDDLGYKTSTMVAPDILRKLVFPWLKKYSSLAHKSGRMFWFHSCGNISEVMNDLVEDIKIDAFHSFQDTIIPVGKFKKRYENRIAVLGGVDIDKLCRLDEDSLRKYVRDILNQCMPGGKYALGSGNSIANYVPVKNYLIMLEEGLKFKNF